MTNDVERAFRRPRTPTDNAKVERFDGGFGRESAIRGNPASSIRLY